MYSVSVQKGGAAWCSNHVSLIAQPTEMQCCRLPNAFGRRMAEEIILIKLFGRALILNISDQLNWKVSSPPEGGARKNYSKSH